MERRFTLETFHFFLSGNPWVRLLPPFLCGITAGLTIPRESNFFYKEMYGLLVFLLFAYLLTLYNKNGLGIKKWISGSVGLLFICCAGFQLARAGTSLHAPTHFSRHSWKALYVQVHSIPETRGNYIRFEARVLAGRPAAATAGPVNNRTKGRLLVYLRQYKGAIPRYGDELWIDSTWQEVPPPRNPAAFDYRSYLLTRDIYHQTFLSDGQWLASGRTSGNPLIKWAAGLQKRCVDVFSSLFQNHENAALLSAFVLGYRAGIERDTVNAFADTGTIHILSVSGLHVAILYWLLNLLLRPLGSLRGGATIRLLCVTGAISIYALVTGLSSPVCRAGCMIIIYAIAQYIGRQHKSANVLALTAFLLLWADPLALATVGFQLSFIAVGGLICFYPPLERLYRPMDGRLWQRSGKYLWSMTAVSLAAQLATFPLSVYYFHQFPVYFLPANLVLVPLAGLILYGGILLLLISPAGVPAVFFAKQLSLLTDGMKSAMFFFSELPGAVLKGIWITPAECIALYVLILTGTLLLLSRKVIWLTLGLCVSVSLAASSLLENYRQVRQRVLIYFHQSPHPVIGFLAGRSAVLFMDTSFSAQDYAFSIKPFLDRSGITRITTAELHGDLKNVFIAKKGPFIQFFDRRILLLGKRFGYPGIRGEALPCDLLLITENTYLQMEKLNQTFRVKMLVSGAGVSNALDNYLEKHCQGRKIPFYSIGRSGAFINRLQASTTGTKEKNKTENGF